ncbi:uncharacterized protein Z518_09150 [Rhinocladiella mackenziei CBS 650.93]|uniref:Uncharacterized protein n=1 Tax=Rhinocladiella mackenziei CBS 650.93 TaxID=1442369 RepID=A0A0D2I6J4_9EURO|nr:uncharacterized protein Z518_09150 [Rhinocladiella mackenziei CBS 650.93]KIX01424.1 hypothetical protein Z518_09150 [Rhinocladiella mackenziei CBS 650.93]
MGGIDVASVVASILSAFGSGMDVFRRLGGKKRKSHARLPRPSEEEEWLRHSLKNRPLEIKNEYDQNVAQFGRRFEVGDGEAQSSLAHTLLVLNTGLINLINHALSGDSKTKSTSRNVLFNLSETAAVDTMTALGQLNSRLSLSSQLRYPGAKENPSPSEKHGPQKKRKRNFSSTTKQVKRPPPAPLLVRGGWVRSKSGSSVVSGAAARKAREGISEKRHRSKSDTDMWKKAASQSHLPAPKRSNGTSECSSCTGKSGSSRPEAAKLSDRHRSNEHSESHRQPSLLLVPSDFFDAPAEPTDSVPPRPPKIPPHSRPSPRTNQLRPTSTMTFMTTSTKIGEIPESRWPERILSAEEEESKRMPYTIPPPEPEEPRRKKGFKFWKKDEKRRDVMAD